MAPRPTVSLTSVKDVEKGMADLRQERLISPWLHETGADDMFISRLSNKTVDMFRGGGTVGNDEGYYSTEDETAGKDREREDIGAPLLATTAGRKSFELNCASNSRRASLDIFVAMLSNFGTAYNVVNISMALKIMKGPELYGEGLSSEDPFVDACSYMLIGGMIVGQLIFGTLGDFLGLELAMSIAMSIQILGSVLSSVALPVPGFGTRSVFFMLAAFRFLLGVGCGGVYPLAAALSARSPTKKEDRGQSVALVFSMQGIGYLVAPTLAYVLLLIFGETNYYVWRVLLGIGCIPGLILLYMRMVQARAVLAKERVSDAAQLLLDGGSEDDGRPLPPSSSSSSSGGGAERLLGLADKKSDDDLDAPEARERESISAREALRQSLTVDLAVVAKNSHSVWEAIKIEENIVVKIVGTAGCWLLFDVLFYGNTLFQPIVLDAAFGDAQTTTDTAKETMLVTCMAVPGYFVSVYFISKVGPRRIQAQGFLFMALLYFLIGFLWDIMTSHTALLLVSYGATFFFSNFGPNSTTFVLPSMTFSPTCRSTLNGLCAASGKFGAFLGALLFSPAAAAWGDSTVMIVCGALSLIGLAMTLGCVKEDVGRANNNTTKASANADAGPTGGAVTGVTNADAQKFVKKSLTVNMV